MSVRDFSLLLIRYNPAFYLVQIKSRCKAISITSNFFFHSFVFFLLQIFPLKISLPFALPFDTRKEMSISKISLLEQNKFCQFLNANFLSNKKSLQFLHCKQILVKNYDVNCFVHNYVFLQHLPVEYKNTLRDGIPLEELA